MYISRDYTLAQIAMRLTYCAISCIIFMGYATKLTCRVPNKSKSSLTEEQWQIFALSAMLVFFNDPFYIVAVLHPGQAAIIFNHLFMAVFVATMLCFWLRINLKLGSTDREPSGGKCMVFVKNFIRVNKSMWVKLGILWCLMLIAMMELAFVQQYESQTKPTFSIYHAEDIDSIVLAMILTLVVLIFIYYTFYFLAIFLSCKDLCKKDVQSKIIFSVN